MALDLSKQALLINGEKMKEWTISIFGAGSIGSHLTRALVKTGFENIEVWDFDEVEADNIPAQAFGLKHIDMKKTEALKELIKEETGVEIVTHEGKVDEKTEIKPDLKTIYFCAFDSIPARKLVYDKLKKFPVVWGETRIGRFDYRYYFVVPGKTPESWKGEYEKELDPKQGIMELKCGEKCSFGPNTDLVSRVLRQILNIVEGKDFTYKFIGNWQTPNVEDSITKDSYRNTWDEAPKEKTEMEKDLEMIEVVEV